MRRSLRLLLAVLAMIAPLLVGLATPALAFGYRIDITCHARPIERQLSPEDCLNYIPDGTQTYTAKVTDGAGNPVSGVRVRFSDSAQDAFFRPRHVSGRTNRYGKFSDELVDRHPRRGEVIRVTATIVSSGVKDSGTLRFR